MPPPTTSQVSSTSTPSSKMPTTQGRPFFANFLAAFRAHSAIQQSAQASSKGGLPSTSPSSQPQHNSSSHSSASPSNPRTITTSTNKQSGATTTALSTLHSPRNLSASTSPLSSSPEQNTGATPRYIERRAVRRGSDSSSEGFRDVLGAEKWYIGGRTAAGEERYFKLGVVRRQRSADRLSLDRLSL